MLLRPPIPLSLLHVLYVGTCRISSKEHLGPELVHVKAPHDHLRQSFQSWPSDLSSSRSEQLTNMNEEADDPGSCASEAPGACGARWRTFSGHSRLRRQPSCRRRCLQACLSPPARPSGSALQKSAAPGKGRKRLAIQQPATAAAIPAVLGSTTPSPP